jgi:hypothetical protein
LKRAVSEGASGAPQGAGRLWPSRLKLHANAC